ncbi:MAG: DUF4317 domain-containing protein [Eubacterium sp.]|nr:DUF4317 domain-containing protein [Eubacterium sp.]
MNKKEVLEIKKILKKDDTRIDRIACCYVDGEKKKVTEYEKPFLTLPDEEMFKYTDIIRKSLSGAIGKNLLNLDFPLEEEAEGGRQKRLLDLLDSELKDQGKIEDAFDAIIASYLNPENYLILLAHGMYDVPGKASDNLEMEDASDYVYPFLICCICPVTLSKPGLIYSAADQTFVDSVQDHMVQMPEIGFLFPAFNDRNSDIHSLLYYSKNPDICHPEITEDVLGCTVPMAASDQKKTFDELVEDTFQEDCTFDLTKKIHENMNALLEGKKEDPEPTPLDKNELKKFMEHCGADNDQIQAFEDKVETNDTNDTAFIASNLANTRKFEVKTPDIRISVDPTRTDLIESRMIDGQEYLVIPVSDDILVNGIRIRPKSSKTDR